MVVSELCFLGTVPLGLSQASCGCGTALLLRKCVYPCNGARNTQRRKQHIAVLGGCFTLAGAISTARSPLHGSARAARV
eukprot:5687534-Alexandrium_andersonii.AAC.1